MKLEQVHSLYLAWAHVEKVRFRSIHPPNTPFERALQFLPIHYLTQNQALLVSEQAYDLAQKPQCQIFDFSQFQGIHTPHIPFIPWAWTPELYSWAEKRQLQTPQKDAVFATRHINHKSFLITHRKKQILSRTIDSFETLKQWTEHYPNIEWRIKAGYSHAGLLQTVTNSYRILSQEKQLQKIILHSPPAIVEENLTPLATFSTLWQLSSSEKKQLATPSLRGSTLMSCTKQGRYLGAQVYLHAEQNPLFEKNPFLLHDHINQCQELLVFLQEEGYEGPVCFDAIVYEKGEVRTIICDLNARMSLGRMVCSILKAAQRTFGLFKILKNSQDVQGQALLPKKLISKIHGPLSLPFNLYLMHSTL